MKRNRRRSNRARKKYSIEVKKAGRELWSDEGLEWKRNALVEGKEGKGDWGGGEEGGEEGEWGREGGGEGGGEEVYWREGREWEGEKGEVVERISGAEAGWENGRLGWAREGEREDREEILEVWEGGGLQ